MAMQSSEESSRSGNVPHGNGNTAMWMAFYRAVMAAALGLVIWIGKTALDKLDQLALVQAGQTVRLEGFDIRLLNAETQIRSHDQRINDNSARVRVLESVR